MKKALITGSEGFVGKYLRRELEEHGYTVTGLDLQAGDGVIVADLLDADTVTRIMKKLRPDAVFHLAGQANVAKSWTIPQKTVELNVIAAINLMEAVRKVDLACRIVMVGSSDQYGNLGEKGQCITETLELKPQTPYAVSKKAQEDMAKVYCRAYGMNICMTRSFNHSGPGQSKGFLISDLASGIVAVEQGKDSCVRVGNLVTRRDFTHVLDVVRAYRVIAEKGKVSEVYNVGSGITYSAQEILDKLCSMANCTIPVQQDPTKMRPSDTPVICCNHSKLTEHTGWVPELPMDQILQDVLQYWRQYSQGLMG